jgi:hypothetical protein
LLLPICADFSEFFAHLDLQAMTALLDCSSGELFAERPDRYSSREIIRPALMFSPREPRTHPIDVPKEWIAKFKGKFDGGWGKYREGP